MRKKIITISCFIVVLAFQLQSLAQFTPEELAEREKWEEFLKTAEITGHRDIEVGVTKPIQIFLKKGEKEWSGAWKNPRGMQQGFLEGWQYEIAAYKMDKLLGLNMIAPTVEREFSGKRGSLQLWVVYKMDDSHRMDENIPIPESKVVSWNKQKYLMRAFDCLIANEDRTQQNIVYVDDWRMILIDHSRSFRSSKKFTNRLVYGKNGIMSPKLFRELPRNFVEEIKALTYEMIKEAVDPYLKDKEIRAILVRKKLLLDEIEEMIRERGEGNVLY